MKGVAEFDELDRSEKTVEVNVTEVNNRLGTNISIEEIEDILRKLRFSFERNGGQYLLFISQHVVAILRFLKICWRKLHEFMDMTIFHIRYQ